MSFDWAPVWPSGPGMIIPHVQDVGMAVDFPIPGLNTHPWFVGSDGSLWLLDRGAGFKQVASPGDLARVAVSPDGSIWCVDNRDQLWKMRSNIWSQIEVPGERVMDVDVSVDGTVWLLMVNRRYYTISPGGNPVYHGVIVPLDALAGFAGPDDANPYGKAWGVSSMFGTSALCRCDTTSGWFGTNIQNVRQVSVSSTGITMLKTDGTIWMTTDGLTQTRAGLATNFSSIAQTLGFAYAVKSDGSAWVWRPIDTPAPPAPPAPPTPPAPPSVSVVPPTLSVRASGGGIDSVFRATGSGFLSNVQVTLRGARIEDGQVRQFYWSTISSSEGKIEIDLPLPCVPGIGISFSANDGRYNSNDRTDRLWSNTVPATCLPG